MPDETIVDNQMPVENELERRHFLHIASAVFAGLVLPAVTGKAASAIDGINPVKTPELPQLPEKREGEDCLLRMMRDLQRALAKPLQQRRWIMVIDLRKCVGCKACTISCVVENKLPPGVVYRPVLEEEIGEFPYVTRRFVPRPCMQCEKPPCVPVCPVGATYKRPDGITAIDYKKCIGCRYCVTACPYNARTFDFGEYYSSTTPAVQPIETAPNYEYGRAWNRTGQQSPIGNVRKCHFCIHRVEQGLLPQCVTTCIGRATFYGDANDRESLVVELKSKPNVMRLKEEFGTEPKVYYLV